MKNISISLILILTACSNSLDSKYSPTIDKNIVHVYDAKFNIIIVKYPTGRTCLSIVENKMTRLEKWNEYYENGQLKYEGIRTQSNFIDIGRWRYYSKISNTSSNSKGMSTVSNFVNLGKWRYYSETGLLDSIIDFDKKYKVRYHSAIHIAYLSGLKLPNLTVSIKSDGRQTFWEVINWTVNNTNLNSILINTETGRPCDRLIDY